MIIQKLYTDEAKIFSKLTSIILTVWLITFLLGLLIGAFYLGHIPVYGNDGDPSSLNLLFLDAIKWMNLFSFFFSFFAFFAWPLLTIHLLINKAPFARTDKALQASALLSIVIFFLFKYLWTDQFLWFND